MANRDSTRPLTDKEIQHLPPGDYADCPDIYPGLRIRVSPQQRRTWYYRPTINGKQAKITIGVYGREQDGRLPAKQARLQWAELERKRRSNGASVDTLRQRPEPVPEPASDDGLTVGDLQADYVQAITRRLKSWKDVSNTLDRVLPAYTDLPVHEFNRGHVKAIVGQLDNQGKVVAANRALAHVRSMFSWAIKNDWPSHDSADNHRLGVITSNPCLGIVRPKEPGRERVLSTAELKHLAQHPLPNWAFFVTVLATGCRISEVATMRYEDIEGDEWLVPQTKNQRQHLVYLAPQLQTIIGDGAAGYVFANRKATHGHIRIDSAEAQLRKAGADFRYHDLRRTMSTWMAEQGHSIEIRNRVFNHIVGGVDAIYTRARHNEPARQVWLDWSMHLEKLGF